MRTIVRFAGWLLLAFAFERIASAGDTALPVETVERFNVSTGGMGLYQPEKWGVIKISLWNTLDREIQLLAATHLVEDPTLQYGRRMWLPPHSKLTSWHPLRMPAIRKDGKQTHFELRTQVLNTAEGTETATTNEFGSQQFDQAFLVARNEAVTALIGDLKAPQLGDAAWANSADFVQTARFDRSLRYNFTLLADQLSPAGEELLDVVDHLVIASDRILNDAASIGAIRRWVTSGGRLWIMADKVSPELLGLLMGDECTVMEVDRVGLTAFNVAPPPGVPGTLPMSREVERPVPFVRMIAHDVQVKFVVDDWPAAFLKPYGNGLVLVTTLGADGWLRPRTATDSIAPGGSTFQTNFAPGGPLSQLALEFFTSRPAPAMSRKMAEEHVRQMIGYEIPGRALVLGTLLGFTSLLAIIGLWLARCGRLERLISVIPTLATVTAGVLMYAGWSSRTTIPTSMAVIQLVQAVPGTDDVRTTGLAGVFSSDLQTTPLSGERGGWMIPQMEGLEGTTRRMVWTDIDTWNWEKLPAPPGLRMVSFQSAGAAEIPLTAVGRFDPKGIAGLLTLPPGLRPADAIIATPRGRMGVDMGTDGRFVARGPVFGATQYLSASLLSDEQQRRNAVLSQLLEPVPGIDNPPVTTLFVWTKPWKVGMSLTRRLDVTGSALVVVPLHWQRPTLPHSRLDIPAPMLPFSEVLGPDGLRPSGLYDVRRGKWVERAGSTAGWLAFELPKSLLPLEVKSATITFKVLGPMERLQLSTIDGMRLRSIKVWNTPVGTLTHEITDPGSLKLDPFGRLLLRIDVGSKSAQLPSEPGVSAQQPKQKRIPTEEAPVSYWQFEDVSLQLSAEIPSHEPIPGTIP